MARTSGGGTGKESSEDSEDSLEDISMGEDGGDEANLLGSTTRRKERCRDAEGEGRTVFPE